MIRTKSRWKEFSPNFAKFRNFLCFVSKKPAWYKYLLKSWFSTFSSLRPSKTILSYFLDYFSTVWKTLLVSFWTISISNSKIIFAKHKLVSWCTLLNWVKIGWELLLLTISDSLSSESFQSEIDWNSVVLFGALIIKYGFVL